MKETHQVKHGQESDTAYHGIHIDFAYMTFLSNCVGHEEKHDALQEIEEHCSE
jgi:hypothetical protein